MPNPHTPLLVALCLCSALVAQAAEPPAADWIQSQQLNRASEAELRRMQRVPGWPTPLLPPEEGVAPEDRTGRQQLQRQQQTELQRLQAQQHREQAIRRHNATLSLPGPPPVLPPAVQRQQYQQQQQQLLRRSLMQQQLRGWPR